MSKGNEHWFEKSGVKLQRRISKGNENRFEKSGVKLQRRISKGNENWFEKSGGSRNRSTITEKYNQGKRTLLREIGRFEKSEYNYREV